MITNAIMNDVTTKDIQHSQNAERTLVTFPLCQLSGNNMNVPDLLFETKHMRSALLLPRSRHKRTDLVCYAAQLCGSAVPALRQQQSRPGCAFPGAVPASRQQEGRPVSGRPEWGLDRWRENG